MSTAVQVATGTTNTTPGSVVIVNVTDLLLAWEIQDNAFHDKLPIIPTASRVDHGKILYHLTVKVTLHRFSTGELVAGHPLSIKSNRAHDTITLASPITDATGSILVTLETRDKGDLSLTVTGSPDITDSTCTFPITLGEAWYESNFLITGYNVCDEADFTGALVAANGLGDQHRQDFLYGARGVVMEGTGQALNGQMVRFVSMTGGWHHNNAGHADHLNNPDTATFAYTDAVTGSFGPVTVNHSIAVDPTVIPPRARVNVDAVGDRHADDRGSQVLGYHVDNFLGAGVAVVTAWLHGPVNGTQHKIKYLGQ